jgi:hypothetical protein
MRQRARKIIGAVAIATFMLYIGCRSAHADAIDGEWCSGVSHFAIQGPNILTPGGNRIQGDYSRHGFAYVAPANETDAGREISMMLLNEETVAVTRKGQSSPPEIWNRCKPTS